MAKRKVTFSVTSGPGIQACWIAVDDLDIPNGSNVELTVGEEYQLVWWMLGKSGSSINILGEDTSGNPVVERKSSKVPAGRSRGAGSKYFTP